MKRTKKIINEFKEAKPKEISYAIWENFFFGFSGAIIVPFIALRMDSKYWVLSRLDVFMVNFPSGTGNKVYIP